MLNTFLLGFQHCEVNLATSQLGSTCTTVKQPRVVPPRDMSDTQWYLAVSPGLRTSSCIVHLAHLVWVFHTSWSQPGIVLSYQNVDQLGFSISFSTIWSSSIGQLSRQIETVDTEIALLHLARQLGMACLWWTIGGHSKNACICCICMYVEYVCASSIALQLIFTICIYIEYMCAYYIMIYNEVVIKCN